MILLYCRGDKCPFQIEIELRDICNDVLDIITEYLIPNVSGDEKTMKESKVFYYKMYVIYVRVVKKSGIYSLVDGVVQCVTCYCL